MYIETFPELVKATTNTKAVLPIPKVRRKRRKKRVMKKTKARFVITVSRR